MVEKSVAKRENDHIGNAGVVTLINTSVLPELGLHVRCGPVQTELISVNCINIMIKKEHFTAACYTTLYVSINSFSKTLS